MDLLWKYLVVFCDVLVLSLQVPTTSTQPPTISINPLPTTSNTPGIYRQLSYSANPTTSTPLPLITTRKVFYTAERTPLVPSLSPTEPAGAKSEEKTVVVLASCLAVLAVIIVLIIAGVIYRRRHQLKSCLKRWDKKPTSPTVPGGGGGSAADNSSVQYSEQHYSPLDDPLPVIIALDDPPIHYANVGEDTVQLIEEDVAPSPPPPVPHRGSQHRSLSAQRSPATPPRPVESDSGCDEGPDSERSTAERPQTSSSFLHNDIQSQQVRQQNQDRQQHQSGQQGRRGETRRRSRSSVHPDVHRDNRVRHLSQSPVRQNIRRFEGGEAATSETQAVPTLDDLRDRRARRDSSRQRSTSVSSSSVHRSHSPDTEDAPTPRHSFSDNSDTLRAAMHSTQRRQQSRSPDRRVSSRVQTPSPARPLEDRDMLPHYRGQSPDTVGPATGRTTRASTAQVDADTTRGASVRDGSPPSQRSRSRSRGRQRRAQAGSGGQRVPSAGRTPQPNIQGPNVNVLSEEDVRRFGGSYWEMLTPSRGTPSS